MISPITMFNLNKLNPQKKQNKNQPINSLGSSKLRLCSLNNQMRTYVSFGYCERNDGHYQKMYEIDTNFAKKIEDRITLIEQIKNKAKQKYSLEDESNLEAAKIIMQYSNMQTVFAEMPPAYTIVTGTKLKEAMNKTQTFANPVDNLIVINNITKITGLNKDLPQSRQGKATRAAQLYSTLILLNQIKENTPKLQFRNTEKDIKDLVRIVETTIKDIYGNDIFERVDKISQMGRKVSLENQKMALNFLIEIDCISKDLKFSSEFEEKLTKLIEKQNAIEDRTEIAEKSYIKPNRLIKVFYPDHEHTMDHLNGKPHTHDHHHGSQYKKILENAKTEKIDTTNQVSVNEKEEKSLYKGE